MVRLLTALAVLLLVPAAARAAAPGTPDASFAGDGVATRLYPGQFAEGQAVVPTPGPLAVVGDLATTLATPGATVVAGFGNDGAPAAGFGSTVGWPTASPFVAGAVREAGGRIVAARGGTPGNVFPTRTELVGYDSNGQLDPTFGTGGRPLLSASAGLPVKLLLAPAGTLLVVGS